jgi:hypothetical protein
MDKIKLYEKDIKRNINGDVLKFFDDRLIKGIKEIYFSNIKKKRIKGWKKNKSIDQFMYVVNGTIKFVLYNEKKKKFNKFILGHKRKYAKIIIPKNIWYAFEGLDQNNLIINALKIRHDKCNIINKKINKITKYDL